MLQGLNYCLLVAMAGSILHHETAEGLISILHNRASYKYSHPGALLQLALTGVFVVTGRISQVCLHKQEQ